jgi:hypothetical protein
MEQQVPHPAPDRIFVQLAGVLTLAFGLVSLFLNVQATYQVIGFVGWTDLTWVFFQAVSWMLNGAAILGGIAILLTRNWGWTTAMACIAYSLVMTLVNIGISSQTEYFMLANYLDIRFLGVNSLKVAALVFLLLRATRQALGIQSSHFITAAMIGFGLVAFDQAIYWTYSVSE